MSDEQLIKELEKEACALGSRNYEARAFVPAKPTDTDELMSTAAARIAQLNERVDEGDERVEQLKQIIETAAQELEECTDNWDVQSLQQIANRVLKMLNE